MSNPNIENPSDLPQPQNVNPQNAENVSNPSEKPNPEPVDESQQDGTNKKEDPKQIQLYNNQVEQYLQVGISNRPGDKLGNKEQFLRIYRQISEQKQQMDEEARKLEKRKQLKKKQSEAKVDKISTASEEKRTKILKQIEPVMKRYRNLNNPGLSDTEVAKLRYQGKQKLFKSILYLREEAKDLSENELDQKMIEFKKLELKQVVDLAKSICRQVDFEFFAKLNLSNKIIAEKKFRFHWKNLTSNLLDDTNYELRKKVATREWDAKRLVGMDEMDLYSASKRQIIEQKNKRLMNEATIEKTYHVNEAQNEIPVEQKPSSWADQPKTEQKKPTYRFFDEGSLQMICDLISQDHIAKMKKFLDESLKGEIRQRLVGSIARVFQHKAQDD